MFQPPPKKDSCFLLKNTESVFVKEKRDDKKYVCDVLKRSNLESFYDSPCDSKLLNTVVVKKRNMHLKRKLLEHTDFEKKLICLPWIEDIFSFQCCMGWNDGKHTCTFKLDKLIFTFFYLPMFIYVFYLYILIKLRNFFYLKGRV